MWVFRVCILDIPLMAEVYHPYAWVLYVLGANLLWVAFQPAEIGTPRQLPPKRQWMKTQQSQHVEKLRMVNLRHHKYTSKMPNTQKSIIVWLVTCLKCRVFTLKSDPVRSFHGLEIAFYSKIMMFLAFFERHIIWNMVIAQGDLSSCFLLPFITLKLEVVTPSLSTNLWKLQLQVPGTSWSALKFRQVEWPSWIIRRRRTVTREHNIDLGKFITTSGHPKWRNLQGQNDLHSGSGFIDIRFYSPKAKMNNLRYIIKQVPFTSQKKKWKAHTNKLKWCRHNWCEMRWIRWEFVGPCWQKRSDCRFKAGAIQTSFPLNKLQGFLQKTSKLLGFAHFSANFLSSSWELSVVYPMIHIS